MMKEDKRNLCVAGVCLIACVMFVMLFHNYLAREERRADASQYEIKYYTYEIKDGDTAFSIAKANKYPTMDIRDYVKELGEVNNDINFFYTPLKQGSYLLVPKYTRLPH